MDVIIFILLVVTTKWTWCVTTSISGVISEDVTFIHKTFPVPSSKRAIIEVYVSFPYRYIVQRRKYPLMGIYTTKDHINIKKQCTSIWYGQLVNENLHFRIRKDRGHLQKLKCLKESDDNIHCTGNITVQDFKPRNFSFSFGFRCVWISSLKGLSYNITIHGQTNETNCISLPDHTMTVYKQYYQHTTLPNLVGSEDMRRVMQIYEMLKTYDTFIDLSGLCYQYFEEIACHTVVPKCDPMSRQVVHPCREMCHDLKTACSKITLPQEYISE